MKAADLPCYYNAVDILERNLPVWEAKVALYSTERTLTFQQVLDEVNQIGNALRKLDIHFGDVVGILAPDSAEWATTFFGVIKIGAIALGINTLLQPHEYGYILHDSRARALVVHESLLQLIEPVRDGNPTLRHVIVIGQTQRLYDLTFQGWICGEEKQLVAEATHRDDFCSLHYSSGTTGEPKGILHAHKDYPLTAQLSGKNYFGLSETDITFSVAKLFFSYGLGGNLIFPWYAGASIVLHAGQSQQIHSLLEAIEHFRPTVLYGIPTAYIAMLAMNKFANKYKFEALRLCLSAGEALPASIGYQWQERTGLELIDTVGCTETFHTFLANSPGELCLGSSGKPVPGYEIKIVDDIGNTVASGDIGNLMVKGESVALFYLHQYEKSRHAFRGEWFLTGDKYSIDSDGFYWHAGRSDDMFKVGGLWVAPVEVESILISHPAVLECAVVEKTDYHQIIKPKAFVCLHPDFTPSNALIGILLQYCGERLAAYKCPRWFEFVGVLPKTATGKIQRFKLRSVVN
jgi:benzoate-CoA ligase family protein